MKQQVSRVLLGLQLLALLVGTQMPNAWRNGAVQAMHAPSWVSSLGHFVLFAGMAMVLSARPMAWPVARIVLAALALALLSEGLQFFALDRHPRWLDVGIDMAGALAGVGLIKLGVLCFARR
ncbi:MAG: VanZ family protein [Polaromonas sp.]